MKELEKVNNGRKPLARMLQTIYDRDDWKESGGYLLDGASLNDLVDAIDVLPRIFINALLKAIFDSTYKKGKMWKKNGMSAWIRMLEDNFDGGKKN